MQKKLLALAIAGALSAPLAAQAQNVQIYGLLQPSIDFIDNGDESGQFIRDNTSRLGFKGSEDLGGGLKAIFQLESALNFDERGDGTNWMNRDSWVGLAGSFGSITVGNHQSAYVRSTRTLDPFADTIGDYNNIMARTYTAGYGSNFNDRFRNSIYYTSPKFGGVEITASYALSTREGFDTPAADADADDVFSLALNWSNGPFALMVAHERQKGAPNAATPATENNRKGFKIGGSFKVLPTTTIYAMAERIDIDDNGTAVDFDSRDAYYIGAKHSMGNIDLQANFMVARDSDELDDGAKSFALGAIYNFSKRTNIGAYYAQTKNDDDVDGRYVIGNYAPAAGEDKVSGFSIRLRHSF